MALVFDPIRTSAWRYDVERNILAGRGVALEVPEDREAADRLLPEADVVVVSSRLPSDRLPELRRCCGIVCYSVGMDGVDRDRAAALGIPVTNVPGYCTEEVADHALALLFALQREIVPLALAGAAGRWAVHRDPPLARIRRMSALKVGIVGAGRIGSLLARRCAALGMSVVAHDPALDPGVVRDLTLVAFDDLLDRSDAVILCAAASAGAAPLIDARALARMRPDALLINVSRGSLVDEAALIAALQAGVIRGAALDVRASEPPAAADPLRLAPNVILTQHLAARSVEAHADLHQMAGERVLEVLERAGRLPVDVRGGVDA